MGDFRIIKTVHQEDHRPPPPPVIPPPPPVIPPPLLRRHYAKSRRPAFTSKHVRLANQSRTHGDTRSERVGGTRYNTLLIIIISLSLLRVTVDDDADARARTTTMTDHQRPYNGGGGSGGGGSDRRWPAAIRPNKKFMNARKFGGNGSRSEQEDVPGNWRMMSPRYFQTFNRTASNFVETCENVEWEAMSKHFASW